LGKIQQKHKGSRAQKLTAQSYTTTAANSTQKNQKQDKSRGQKHHQKQTAAAAKPHDRQKNSSKAQKQNYGTIIGQDNSSGPNTIRKINKLGSCVIRKLYKY
jgi:hypothetical protein